MISRTTVGEALANKELVTEKDLVRAGELAKEDGVSVEDALVKLKLVSPQDLLEARSETSGLPMVSGIKPAEIPSSLIRPVPIQFAKRHKILPLWEEDDAIVVAVADPRNIEALNDLRVLLNKRLSPRLALADEVLEAINRAYEMGSGRAEELMEDLEEDGLSSLAHELEEPKDLLDASDEAPIIRLVNGMLFQAVKDRASDIHIEPFEREIQVRYRIDGVLYPILSPPKAVHAPMVSRIKVMASLDIAEKRLPQDGRIRLKIAGKDIDIRVSVLPTSLGERVVMRLLDKTAVLLDLEELGMEGDRLESFKNLITRPHGIILVTGPTGSGKTTTLYGGLSRINSRDINIITVEDPVEYQLKGVGQIHVNPKIDLTFANGLRSILRQDPDVIMVGEIRDGETAEIAIQASLTGHLVLSTLHTNDAAGAITRLVEMGVEPFLVSSSVLAILAQRLVRVLCKSCKEPYSPSEAMLKDLGIKAADLRGGVLYKPVGCAQCRQTGYRGRTGIYELLLVTEKIRDLVMEGANANSIKEAARRQGMLTLREDGVREVIAGVTSPEDVLRVTQDEAV